MSVSEQPLNRKQDAENGNRVIVWEFVKNPRGEVIRVDCHTWKGRPLVSIRTWYRDQDGELKPGREGFSIAPEKLSDLQTAIERAREEATARGWF